MQTTYELVIQEVDAFRKVCFEEHIPIQIEASLLPFSYAVRAYVGGDFIASFSIAADKPLDAARVMIRRAFREWVAAAKAKLS